MTQDKHRVDSLHPVTEDEAVGLMLHHLEIAATYFEATPEDLAALKSAVADKFGGAEIQARAAQAFVEALHVGYEAFNLEGLR